MLSPLLLEEHVCIVGDVNIDLLCPIVGLVADYLESLWKWGLETRINQATCDEF